MVRFLIPQLGVIYLLKCNKTGMVYVGCSFAMDKRIYKHSNKNNRECSSRIIVDNGDFQFIELFSVNVYSKQELIHHEKKIIRFYKHNFNNLCVNVRDRYENDKEYYENNKDRLNQDKKKYQKNKKEKIRERKRDRYEKKVIKNWLDDLINQIQ